MKVSAVGTATVVLVLLSGAGCASSNNPPQSKVSTTAALESSAQPPHAPSPVPPPRVSSGPITTPVQGTAVRKALMDAARRGLGTSSQFMVYQLHVQGPVALADVEPVSGGGGRRLAGFVRQPNGSWKLVWSAVGGRTQAAAVRTAIPQASPQLVAALDLRKPASKSGSAADVPAPVGNFNRAFIESWSPAGDSSSNGMPTVRIRFDNDDNGHHKTVVYSIDSGSTSLEVSHSQNLDAGYVTVSRSKFFAAVKAGAQPNVSSNVKAVWRVKGGKKVLILRVLRASFSNAG